MHKHIPSKTNRRKKVQYENIKQRINSIGKKNNRLKMNYDFYEIR